jgi:Uri superfamily endonuclease
LLRGAYLLILRNNEDISLRVGSLGVLSFRKGFYIYVGSAKAGIEGRIRRYIEGPSRIKWHIDYLITAPSFRLESVIKIESGDEVKIAKNLSEILSAVNKFGSSDDRENKSHLFFSESNPLDLLLNLVGRIGYENLEVIHLAKDGGSTSFFKGGLR